MALFREVFDELKAGKSLRRDDWDCITRMYYDGPNLVQQCGDGPSYHYQVTEEALAATDWSVATMRWIQVPIESEAKRAA